MSFGRRQCLIAVFFALTGQGRDFAGEVVLRAFDTFAKCETKIARDLERCTDILGRSVDGNLQLVPISMQDNLYLC